MHQFEPASSHARVGRAGLEDALTVTARRSEFLGLELLEPLEAMLVEGDDERNPGKRAGQHHQADPGQRGVGLHPGEDEHQQPDDELQDEPETGYASGLLVGEVVDPHGVHREAPEK